MTARFFSETPIEEGSVTLVGDEHHHITKVMRLGVGDLVTVFDDSGFEFAATISDTARNATQLRIDTKREINRELAVSISLAVALPKGDRQQWLVEKATELGVESIIPLITRRGIAQPGESALKRLRKWIVAASKQCGRNRLMRIASPQSATTLFAQGNVLVAHPDGEASLFRTFLTGPPRPTSVLLAVGPEGGFTEEEVAIASDSGCSIVHLGPRTLRIETAALTLATSVALWHDSAVAPVSTTKRDENAG